MCALPLEGIRILDASNLIAAPFATMLLADYGADVIKIEMPNVGDQLRNHGAVVGGVPLWWTVASRNKRCITLNLNTPEGRDLVLRLVRTCDVLVENYRPGTFERWGLGYDVLSETNPELIFARVSGYGQDGPDRFKPGFGTIGEAMSGFTYRNGMPDGPPVLPPFGLADGVTALTAANAIQTALLARYRGHGGQEIDVAVSEALIPMLVPQEITYGATGYVSERSGSTSTVNAPRDIYPTSDGRWIAVSTSTTSTAGRLMTMVGAGGFVSEDWFNAASGRVAHRAELDAPVRDWMSQHTREEILAAGSDAGVPLTTVNSVEDVFAEPQYVARDSVPEVSHPTLGSVRMPGLYYRLSKTPGEIRWAGPAALGADNEAVYTELGLSPAEMADLTERGVI